MVILRMGGGEGRAESNMERGLVLCLVALTVQVLGGSLHGNVRIGSWGQGWAVTRVYMRLLGLSDRRGSQHGGQRDQN